MTEEAEPIVLEVDEKPKKPKRVMSEAQREGLAKGRAALAAKRAAQKSIQIVPIEKTDDAAPEPAPHNDDEPKASKPARPKVPPPPPEPVPPPAVPAADPQPPPAPSAKSKRTKSEQKTIKAIQTLPKKQMQAVEKDQLKYMTKETKAQLQQARRLRDAAEAREMSLNSIIEQKVAREVANYKRQEKLKKAAELLQQEANKPPPPVPEPRVHYEDSEEEEEDNEDNGDNGDKEETQEMPARSVTFQQPAQQPRNALHGRAWANDPYLAKMMAGMR
jgi:hypothetical protein